MTPTGLSVMTIVRDREVHLARVVDGLKRSGRRPDEFIIVDMSTTPIAPVAVDFPIVVHRFATDGLPLAAARNLAARIARFDTLVFLDVDCIPLRDCLGRLETELAASDALLCADVRYLPPAAALPGWDDAELLAAGKPHPVRDFPSAGTRRETNAGLFWSLAFAIRRSTFARLGGFDERFTGYGAEDTDFGFRAAAAGLPLLFVGGAIACHQHHPTHEPPVQHLRDIVRNAIRFRILWGRWPMEGWLAAFERMGLIRIAGGAIETLRPPRPDEIAATLVRDGEDERLAAARSAPIMPAS